MSTIYLPVVGYSRYLVGSDGTIWMNNQGSPGKQRRLSPTNRPGFRAYPYVELSQAGVQKRRPVHQLVLEAFVGPRPEGCVARHLDDDPLNNELSNLRWGTPKQNWEDRRRNGGIRVAAGEAAGHAKLTQVQADEIRKLANRFSKRELGRRFGISEAAVRAILRNATYTRTYKSPQGRDASAKR